MLKMLLGMAGIAALTAGCAAENLFVAHRTVIGVNAAVNTDQTNGRLIVGYKRSFVTIAPKSVTAEDGTKEAMSVLSCSELEVDGIRLSKFVEQLATGKAAKILAATLAADGNGADMADVIFDCWEDSGDEE